jgi:hypothetical protein
MKMVRKLVSSAMKAADAIISEQQSDGSIGPDVSYSYKAVWPLALAGRAEEATVLLDWVSAKFLKANGEFRCDEKVYAPNQVNWRFLYPNAWLAIGAIHLERLDIAARVGSFIERHQSENGGFPAARDLVAGDVPQDMLSACIAGLVLLYQGKIEKALKAGKFLIDLYEAQPDPANRIYLNLTPSGRLLTEYPQDRSYMYLINKHLPEQPYFAPGAAMAFLSKLFMVSGKNEYLGYAEQYYRLALSPHSDIPLGLFDYPTSGKIGWGAGNLFRATGSPAYRAVAERVGTYLLKTQLADGRWPRFWDNSDTNLAAEFCAWLIEMAKAIAER